MQSTNACIRCGKERIVAKRWEEKVGISMVTYTITVCPDAECQKIVEDQLQKKKDKIDAIQEESLKRRKAIKRTGKAKK